MSYIQGTVIRVIGEFRNADTKALEDPDDVVVTIWPPEASALATIVQRLSDADGSVTKTAVGLFQTRIDTSPAAGEWEYVFEGTGVDAVAKKRTLRVRERPVVVA